MILISTPFGKRGVFYESYYTEGFSTYHFPSSINPLIKPDFLTEQRKRMSEIDYLQEYDAQFIDESAAYFPFNLLQPCIKEYQFLKEGMPGKEYYMGVDFGKYIDASTLYVVEKDSKTGELRVAYIEAWNGKDYSHVVGRVVVLAKQFKARTIYLDKTSVGEFPVELLARMTRPDSDTYDADFQSKVDGITFSLDEKITAYTNLRMLFERKLITIPDHKVLVSELHSLQYEMTVNGKMKFHHPEGGHDDHPSALAWACRCAMIARPTGTSHIYAGAYHGKNEKVGFRFKTINNVSSSTHWQSRNRR
jgi:phage FluMu gp28-like protein